jgi:flagellar biogenesis protein FliO
LPDAQTPPRTKRAVSSARVVAARAPRGTGFRVPRPAAVIDNDDTGVNYALRMTEPLDAISSAQAPAPPPRKAPTGTPGGKPSFTFARLRAAFANLPPIRLPIGPSIPWRFGLPALVVLVLVTVFVARPTAQADSQVSRLPTPETYPVQQEAPLFTDAQQAQAPPPAPQPLGVPDPGGVGFDVVDIGLKLIAVLALAYGSLVLLKRTGMGGAAVVKAGGKTAGMQVVSSLTLAPNRTVHLLRVPGGKTVLVGATPNQVNLIADLGEIAEDLESDAAGSFFDILKGKIPQ